jgi:hypothetical protein
MVPTVTPAPNRAKLANASMLFINTCLTLFEDLPAGKRWEVLENRIVVSRKMISWYKFKITRPVRKWTIWGTFGPKFPGFFFN